jgi:hypothetical protein
VVILSDAIELEPQHIAGKLREFLDGRTRHCSGRVGNTRALRRFRQALFSARPHDPGHPHRRDTERRRVAPAKQLNVHMAGAIVDAVARHQLDRVERGCIARNPAVGTRSAIGCVKAEFGNAPARVLAEIIDRREASTAFKRLRICARGPSHWRRRRRPLRDDARLVIHVDSSRPKRIRNG